MTRVALMVVVNSNQLENLQQELIVLISPEGFKLDWQVTKEVIPEEQSLFQKELYQQYIDDCYQMLLKLGFAKQNLLSTTSLQFLARIVNVFLKNLSREPELELLREQIVVSLSETQAEKFLEIAPYLNGSEYLNLEWFENLWQQLNVSFGVLIQNYQGTVADFFADQNAELHLVGRVFFHLVENKDEEYPFAFLATYASTATKDGRSKHLPLKNALLEYQADQEKLLELLSTVNKVSTQSAFIAKFLESGEIFHPLRLDISEAYTFLQEVSLYETVGILCRIPNWWKQRSNSLSISINIGEKPPSHLGYEALVDFDVQMSLGDEQITIEELKKLLSEAEGLALIKGKWIEVDHEKLKETLKAYEQAQKLADKTDLNIIEAMRFQLNAAKMLKIDPEVCELEITNGAWLEGIIANLIQPEKIENISGGDNFRAQLRTYQEKGLAWLHLMKQLGLGACLADDMGLGKTVQVIALLNYLRMQQQEKALLVVPASLIGNWTNELMKFAPDLKYWILHPSENKLHEEDKERFLNYDLTITTYGMLLKYEWLKEVLWDLLILDEAQAIKNSGTKQTKTVKQLQAKYRIAMTGTPIENRLSDLWSLFDFLNQGLLGTAKEFTNFTKRLKEDQHGYAGLKKVVSPFVLRRLKTDKTIISDLPEKIEMKTYATLTKKQMVLYQTLVEQLRIKMESTNTEIERKGLILSSLMKFKQICNHPDQYLGQDFFAENESGKYARLREICETIYEKRERVLIFTQFKEITEPLKQFLEQIFQHQGMVLHGSTPIAKRKEIVASFQGQEYVPFLVLSIKAGGVGLNLTAANHVVHFDRWWNPAVENQATDRAFRIGQQKNVLVHKFITQGTIEEKIDRLIEEKTKLSQEIIPDLQENWITEMDNQSLMDLFRLSI